MKLWEQRTNFSFESGIRSLLFTILKNYILNELRHRSLVFEKLYEMAQQVNDDDEDDFDEDKLTEESYRTTFETEEDLNLEAEDVADDDY